MEFVGQFLLLFSLCCLVCGQGDGVADGDGTTERCPTATQLIADGCSRGCIINSDSSICLLTCGDSDSCTVLGEGDACEVDLDSIDGFTDVYVPCQNGLVCQRDGLDSRVCTPENAEGPCVRARLDDSTLNCDEDGNYEALQCRKNADSQLIVCRCVDPNGSEVSGTEVSLTDSSDDFVPNCDRDLESCDFDSFSVRSGEKFIDISNCQRCLCTDGEATFCEDLSDDICDRINPTPSDESDCTLRGTTLEDSESASLDCNLCKCSNGELFCTRRLCEEDDDENDEDVPPEERNCRECGAMRAFPVCGNDGKTYPSRCFAVNCRGLDSEDLTPGPCSSRDVCAENLCEDGEVCVRTGGVTCLSSDGCRPDRLRRCVDLDTLRCRSREGDDDGDDSNGESSDGESGDEESSDSEDEDDDEVCGRDMRTYSSVCSLLQNAADVGMAYAGSCNRTECTGDEVCGTDGQTYDNICELRSNSANVRVDYDGACEDDDEDEVVIDKCARLRRSNRCADVAPTCTSRILPEDGCCPVCGGAVTIEFDRDAFDEFIRLNPELETLDEFLMELIASGFIPEEIIRSCTITANLLNTGSLHLLLENILDSANTCRMFAEEIADRINNPPATDSVTGANPQALSFATVAQTSPVVEEAIGPDPSGAMAVVSFSLSLLVLPIVLLFV